MRLKANWIQWLHAYRKRETDVIFQKCPDGLFHCGCELGAGDGYQSTLLSRYILSLISTEINPRLLQKTDLDGIEYRISSAENALSSFGEKKFDIVFSSNVLEHVVDPLQVLSGIHRVLKDHGVTVNVMPGRFWKVCQMLFYVPANVLATSERITESRGLQNMLREIRAIACETWRGFIAGSNATLDLKYEQELQKGNNPQVKPSKQSFLQSLLVPLPHGVSKSHCKEFALFSKKHWLSLFDEAGFACISVRQGPAASGYGLGWRAAAMLCEKLGLASEYIFIARKKGEESPYEKYL